MKTETSTYDKQAEKFLKDTGTTFKAEYVGHDYYFEDDKQKRDIYRITLERNGKRYSFRFGQSVQDSRYPMDDHCPKCKYKGESWIIHMKHNKQVSPTAYDVLAALQKYDIGSIDDFASEFGYSGEKPSKIMKMYSAALDEWENVRRLFGDVLRQLSEIQ